jgi:hypothetical protein
MLERAHRARIDVEVGVQLDEGDLESARLEDGGKRCCCDALAEGGHHTAGDEDELGHVGRPRSGSGSSRACAVVVKGDYRRGVAAGTLSERLARHTAGRLTGLAPGARRHVDGEGFNGKPVRLTSFHPWNGRRPIPALPPQRSARSAAHNSHWVRGPRSAVLGRRVALADGTAAGHSRARIPALCMGRWSCGGQGSGRGGLPHRPAARSTCLQGWRQSNRAARGVRPEACPVSVSPSLRRALVPAAVSCLLSVRRRCGAVHRRRHRRPRGAGARAPGR